VALCAWLGYDYSFLGVLVLCLVAILAYPVIKMVASPPGASAAPAPGVASEALAGDRQRVLRLLEEGKISVDESAELLSALGEGARPATPLPAPAMTVGRRVVLAGAGMLLISFFLPWLHINVGAEMDHMRQQMSQTMPSMPGGPPMGMPDSAPVFGTTAHVPVGFEFDTTLYADDIGHGLGWIVLLLGLGGAVLPYVATTLSAHALRTTTFLALAAGAIIVVYLLTKYLGASPRFIGIGLVLALIGYALELIGAAQEYRAAGQPAARVATA
jgi:hypothetical protein